MQNNIRISRNHSSSVTDQIYDQVKQLILSGQISQGTKIPPLRELQANLQVGISTIRNAFDRLEREGLIVRKPHLGTFVSLPNTDVVRGSEGTHENRVSTIGLSVFMCVPDGLLHNPCMANFIEEFEVSICRSGGSCRMIEYGKDKCDPSGIFEKIADADAILYVSNFVDDEIYLRKLQACQKPIVAYNYSGDRKVAKVSEDWDWAMRLLMTHLINLGHKKIALASFSYDASVIRTCKWKQVRENSFLQIAEEENLPVREKDIYKGIMAAGDSFDSLSASVMDRIVGEGSRYSAIIGINDLLACGIYQRALKLGLRIPDDISLAGFDNTALISQQIGLTTIAHNSREDGISAAKLILEQYRNPHQKNMIHIINKPNIVRRGSTAKLND